MSEEQLAEEMGISLEALRDTMTEISQLSVVSLDEFLHGQEVDSISGLIPYRS